MTKISKQPVDTTPSARKMAGEAAAKAENQPSSQSGRPQTSWPAEGPHARRDLINEDATPGTGLFSDGGTGKPKVDPGAG